LIRPLIGTQRPSIAVVLGSNGGSFAETLTNRAEIQYDRLERCGFAPPGVDGHAGKLVFGRCRNTQVVVMCGRMHCYEGYSAARVAFPIRVLIELGATIVILTNAAGGIKKTYRVGDLVFIEDHINHLGQNPLTGLNDPALGKRFPDMTHVYDEQLLELARSHARILGLSARSGIYAAMAGPSYETPAEINMLQILGVDLVGMSTVPEAIAARHMGARVIGISLVSNLAAGVSPTPLSHDDVAEAGRRAQGPCNELLTRIITAAQP
ncbi:MAG: purine-nucleoside phosphorylase, partial [Candidatus Uhrbacteria bacterium]